MRVVLMTLGTRGDVQPSISLGQALIRRGHRAVVCTGESFRRLTTRHGVEFARVESDLMAMLQTPEGKAVMSGGILNIGRAMRYAREVVNPAFRKSLDDFWSSAQGADLIVYHPKVLAAVDMAQALGIQAVSMPPVPITWPISEFPNMAISPRRSLGPFLNRLTYKLAEKGDMASLAEINDFRAKTLGVGKRKAGAFAFRSGDRDIPIIYPVSPALFEEVTSWKDRVLVPGFFFLDTLEEVLDAELETFLAAGVEPVVATFGSMPLKDPESFRHTLLRALAATGDRAVILTGSTGLKFEGSSNLLAAEGAPHNLLFPRAKGILHHGGVGTVAEALRSGRPQAIMPFSVDQPFWANRLHRLGYAFAPLDERTVTPEQLAVTFDQMAAPDVIARSKHIGEIVRAERGVEDAVDYLENLLQLEVGGQALPNQGRNRRF